MAGADYLKCEICGERIMFEPDRDEDIKVVCMECYGKVVRGADVIDRIIQILSEYYNGKK